MADVSRRRARKSVARRPAHVAYRSIASRDSSGSSAAVHSRLSRPMQAVRLLLLHSEWWERLAPEDHELLHHLPGPHGELCAWLERFIADHGPAPWASLDAALGAHALQSVAQQAMTSMAVDESFRSTTFAGSSTGSGSSRLKQSAEALATRGPADPAALSQLKAVLDRLACAQSSDCRPKPKPQVSRFDEAFPVDDNVGFVTRAKSDGSTSGPRPPYEPGSPSKATLPARAAISNSVHASCARAS